MNAFLPFLAMFLFLLIVYLDFLIGIKTGLKRIISDHLKIKDEINTSGNNPNKVSVIIPFRNESENILNNLKCIEQQDYPKDLFEVIYVNDSSSDDSLEKLNNTVKSCNIKVISSFGRDSKAAFKKIAVSKGIESSTGEIIITSDADTVFGKRWLRSLLEKFDENTGLVSGPVNFIFSQGLFSAFQVLEFSGLVLTGAGLIGINKPVTCNGANLAYRRKAFDEVKGFTGHLHLSSGEDELLMQNITVNTSYKVKFCWDKDSLVSTSPPATLLEFFQQRKRWASKTLHYPDRFLRFRLFLIFLFYLGIPVQLLLVSFSWKLFLFSFIITLTAKFILEYSIIKTGKEFLFPQNILKHFLAAELIQIPYIIISALAGISGKFEWKGRKLK